MCIIMQYHSWNFSCTYFFKRVLFDAHMKSSTCEFIHVWNVPWNFWNIRRMNAYTYEMFRDTFLSCNKSNAYEIVVFDWSMPIIVTSFKMGDTRGLPHSQVCAAYAVNWCVSRWNGRDTMDVIFFFHITSGRINTWKGVNPLKKLFFS